MEVDKLMDMALKLPCISCALCGFLLAAINPAGLATLFLLGSVLKGSHPGTTLMG